MASFLDGSRRKELRWWCIFGNRHDDNSSRWSSRLGRVLVRSWLGLVKSLLLNTASADTAATAVADAVFLVVVLRAALFDIERERQKLLIVVLFFLSFEKRRRMVPPNNNTNNNHNKIIIMVW